MAEEQFNFRDLLDKLSMRIVAFLNDELAIETTNTTVVLHSLQKMQLNQLQILKL